VTLIDLVTNPHGSREIHMGSFVQCMGLVSYRSFFLPCTFNNVVGDVTIFISTLAPKDELYLELQAQAYWSLHSHFLLLSL